MVLGVMGGGVGFELGGKVEKGCWMKGWEWVMLFGSVLGGFLVGVVFRSMLGGMGIDEEMKM